MSNPFSLADVMAVPRSDQRTETRTFHKEGKDFEITIYVDGRQNSARWYEILEAMGQATIDCGKNPQAPLPKGEVPGIKAITPDGKVVQFKAASLVSQIYVFASVAMSPVFGIHEWAIFFDRMGPDLTEEITDWATSANGVDAYLSEKLAKVGKALGEMALGGSSSGPASNSSAMSRKEPSRTSRSRKR